MIEKTGSAVWTGGLKDGTGTVSTQSGALHDIAYSFATRFENRPGTNPEELIGAAHAACFSMALSGVLAELGIEPGEISTVAHITMERSGGGFSVTKSHLEVTILADAPEPALTEAAAEAKTNCPISRLLKAEITVHARKR